jgi:hypothetical protein
MTGNYVPEVLIRTALACPPRGPSRGEQIDDDRALSENPDRGFATVLSISGLRGHFRKSALAPIVIAALTVSSGLMP